MKFKLPKYRGYGLSVGKGQVLVYEGGVLVKELYGEDTDLLKEQAKRWIDEYLNDLFSKRLYC
jgi:hypothetical protein